MSRLSLDSAVHCSSECVHYKVSLYLTSCMCASSPALITEEELTISEMNHSTLRRGMLHTAEPFRSPAQFFLSGVVHARCTPGWDRL